MRQIPFLALVQFSSSAEAGRRGTPARGLSKLSSVAEPASSTWLDPAPVTVRSTFRDVPARGTHSSAPAAEWPERL
jgi:hypothetical protein